MPSTAVNSTSKKSINVVVGIVQHPLTQKFLISRRKDGQHLAGLWEFPGGKVEKGEPLEIALKREFLEEVGIEVVSPVKMTVLTHEYSEKIVKLHFFKIDKFLGDAFSKEGQLVRWIERGELQNYEFPEANTPIFKLL